MTTIAKEDTVDTALISDFLIKNPNFLFENPKLLAKINVKHLHEDGAVSLIEKQVDVLRKENFDLLAQLDNLIRVARKNEVLSNNLHGLASNLLEARSVSDVLAITEDIMRDVFKIDYVAMRMLSAVTDDMLLVIDEQSESELFAELFTINQPLCGIISEEQVAYFFDDQKDRIHSSALVPLKSTRHLGILALGSKDKHRFSHDKGLLFLSHIGDLVSSALLAHIKS